MSWPQLSYVAVDVSFVILITWGEDGLPLHGRETKRTQKKRSKRAREPIFEEKKKRLGNSSWEKKDGNRDGPREL
jgi:hypothetical protein